MKHNVSYKIARGAMRLLAEGTGSADFGAFNLTDEDYALFTGENSWLRPDRPKICQIMDAILWGTMDIIGVPRFPVSAEYLAAAIAVFVSPTNIMPATEWLSQKPVNAAILEDADQLGVEACTPGQLFGLVLMCLSAPNDFKERFELRTGLGVSDAT